MNDIRNMAARTVGAAMTSQLIRLEGDALDIPKEGFLIPAGLCSVENANDVVNFMSELADVLSHKPEKVEFVFGIIEEGVAVVQFLEYELEQHDAMVRLSYWRDKWVEFGMPEEEIDVQFKAILPLDPNLETWSE